MTEQEEITNTIKVLRKEVEVLTERTKDRGTGHLHTAIGVINGRIDELIKEVTAPYFNEEDVYDGYEEHTEAMEQARLKAIQDSAAGRITNTVKADDMFNDYEHTKEYYDKYRNRNNMTTTNAESLGARIRPMEGEDLPSRRPMTVSEQMQEELEPLPINTFK